MNMKRLKKLPEFIRFIMVGVFATALHYGLYFIFQRFINVNIAYSIGYILSFIANFYQAFWFIALLSMLVILPFLGETIFYSKGEPREAIVAFSMLESGNWIVSQAY